VEEVVGPHYLTKRRKTPKIDPSSDETTYQECGEIIEIGEETVIDAVVRQFNTEHNLEK